MMHQYFGRVEVGDLLESTAVYFVADCAEGLINCRPV